MKQRLRDIPEEQLLKESQKFAYQFEEWNDVFDLFSAFRLFAKNNGRSFSELEQWSILSNRFILTDRLKEEEKLFTLSEVKDKIKTAYVSGWNDRPFEENSSSVEAENYLNKVYL